MKIKNKIIIISIISISVLLAGVIAFNVLQNKNITVAKVSSDNDMIYDTIVAEASYSADPQDPENILKGINRHIVKVKVLSVGESEYLPKTEYYNNPYRPCTPIEVEIVENLYGDDVKLLNNKIYIFLLFR